MIALRIPESDSPGPLADLPESQPVASPSIADLYQRCADLACRGNELGYTVRIEIAPGIVTTLPTAPRLTQLQKDAIDAAPSRLHNPISMKRLAKLSGYCYNSYFRKRIDMLVESGLLIKTGRGVRKA